MNIAIYGDSFACINTRFENYNEPSNNIGWPELLEDCSGYEVTNFAQSGTAFMYSYENFLNNYDKFDLNIFVVTNPDRTYIKALDGIRMFGVDWVDVEKNRIKNNEWYPKKDMHLEILDSVRVYLRDWADWDMLKHIQHVLVNNLWNLKENTIVIPGFDTSIKQTTKNLNDCAFHELKITNPQEFQKYPLGKVINKKVVTCKRSCHFSKENNLIIYNLIIDAIANKKRFIEPDLSLIVKPENVKYYDLVELVDY